LNLGNFNNFSMSTVIILVSIFLTHCGSDTQPSNLLSQADIQGFHKLPHTQTTIDTEVIRLFASLDLAQIFDDLRYSYGVKVLVLPYQDSYPEATVKNLTSFNLEEDNDAIEFYTNARRGETADAAFFEAGLILPDRADASKNRPYLNRDLIILHKNADKNALIHEIIHLLISRSPERQALAKRGSVKTDMIHAIEKSKVNFLKSATLVSKQTEEFQKSGKTDNEYSKSIDNLLHNGISFANALGTYSDNSYGEEMDISRLMYQMKNSIFSEGGISKEIYTESLCKGYYEVNFNGWLQDIQQEQGVIESVLSVYESFKSQDLVSKETGSYVEEYSTSIQEIRKKQIDNSNNWIKKVSHSPNHTTK